MPASGELLVSLQLMMEEEEREPKRTVLFYSAVFLSVIENRD